MKFVSVVVKLNSSKNMKRLYNLHGLGGEVGEQRASVGGREQARQLLVHASFARSRRARAALAHALQEALRDAQLFIKTRLNVVL
jgi:hypothetical protein